MALAGQLIRPRLPDDVLAGKRRRVAPLAGAPPAPAGPGGGGSSGINIAPPQAETIPQPPPTIAPPRPPVVAPAVNRPTGEDYLTDFGPGNDLQGTQINPTPTARLQDTQALVTGAQKNLASQPAFTGFQGVAPGSDVTAFDADAATQTRGTPLGRFQGINDTGPAFTGITAPGQATRGPEAARARQLAAQGLEGLIGAPSRQQLADETYRRLEAESLPEAQAAERAAFQRNAAAGRLGSGMLAEDIGDIFGGRKLKLANIRKELASETAGQELGDRLARLSATSGLAGQFQGEDLDTAGFEQGLRGEGRTERGQELDFAARQRAEARGERDVARSDEFAGADLGLRRGSALSDLGQRQFGRGQALREEARGERGTRRDFETGDLNRARSLLQDQADIEGQQFGQEQSARNEVRGERDFQTGRADKAQADRIQQKMLEDALTNSQFGRNLSTSQFENQQADTVAGNAEDSSAAGADLIQEILRSGQAPGLTEDQLRQLLGIG